MLLVRALLFCTAFILPQISSAEVRELSQRELRNASSSQQTIAAVNLVTGVERYTGGKVLEVRAFMVDRDVTYRVLVRQDDGKIGSVLVDGATGHAVGEQSAKGVLVNNYVADQPTTQRRESTQRSARRNDSRSNDRSSSRSSSKPREKTNSAGRSNNNGGGNGRSGRSNNAGGNGKGQGKKK